MTISQVKFQKKKTTNNFIVKRKSVKYVCTLKRGKLQIKIIVSDPISEYV